VSFIQASTKMNIATSIKHFPGHGAVKGDSHKQLVYIETFLSELDNFRQVIQMGKPISVMVGHIAVRNNADFGTKGLPATISENIIRKLLIDSLGFKGIVITDAMNMSAVKPIRGVDLKAVLAGNDMILFPSNPRQLHRSIVQILTTPGIQSERVGESIRKIIRLKICLGLVAQSNTFAS
jgi:beta-N-acetylhexosaminidase